MFLAPQPEDMNPNLPFSGLKIKVKDPVKIGKEAKNIIDLIKKKLDLKIKDKMDSIKKLKIPKVEDHVFDSDLPLAK